MGISGISMSNMSNDLSFCIIFLKKSLFLLLKCFRHVALVGNVPVIVL